MADKGKKEPEVVDDNNTEGNAPAPEEPTGGHQQKKLYRSQTDKMVAGVCGGIGEYLNIDATLVRIFFVISLFAGFGFFAYIVGWIIIPEGKNVDGLQKSSDHSSTVWMIFGAILIMVGLGMFVDKLHYYFYPYWMRDLFSPQIFFAMIFIVGGIFFMLHMMKQKENGELGDESTDSQSSTPFSKTLYRSTKDKKVAGVCGGIGEYFKIDSTIVRVIWIVFTLSTGLFPGLVIYFLLAVILTEQPFSSEEI